ncbi:hypothetical protein [Mycobacterium sp.]
MKSPTVTPAARSIGVIADVQSESVPSSFSVVSRRRATSRSRASPRA